MFFARVGVKCPRVAYDGTVLGIDLAEVARRAEIIGYEPFSEEDVEDLDALEDAFREYHRELRRRAAEKAAASSGWDPDKDEDDEDEEAPEEPDAGPGEGGVEPWVITSPRPVPSTERPT